MSVTDFEEWANKIRQVISGTGISFASVCDEFKARNLTSPLESHVVMEDLLSELKAGTWPKKKQNENRRPTG